VNKRGTKFKNSKGITLIALVITIIVMLILAGVSLNAIIGDNGIITNAQNANMKNGIAILEEFLQQKYVENYENFSDDTSKIVNLQNIDSCRDFFYIPSREGVGSLNYIVDSNGHALYLIKKSGLPNEIKEQLVGGDAGNKTYRDYQTLNDVYGVTSDLKVYYSHGSGANLIGIANINLDEDNPLRTIFDNDNLNQNYMYDLLTDYDTDKDGKISAQEIKSIKTLTIDSGSSVVSLSDLYNLPSLQQLILKNKTLSNLSGIQNCTQLYYVRFEGCVIGDYSELSMTGNALKYLYFYNIDDSEFEKFCECVKNAEFGKLEYFGVVGNLEPITSYLGIRENYTNSNKAEKTISSVLSLKKLSKITKMAIKYLFLNNNNILDLEGIEEFSNVLLLRLEYNKINKLTNISPLSSIEYLSAAGNLLGSLETYNTSLENYGKNIETDSISVLATLSKLSYVNIRSNYYLKWCGYLKDCESIRTLYLGNCGNLSDVYLLKTILNQCTFYEIDGKYSLDLLDAETQKLDLAGYELTYSNLESLGDCSKLWKLDISGIKIKDDLGNAISDNDIINEKIVETLAQLKSLKYLNLENVKGLYDISFVKNMNNLRQINLYGTSVETGLVNDENQKIGLELLNDVSTLKALHIDNDEIDLTAIQMTLNRFTDTRDDNAFSNKLGLHVKDLSIYSQLSECSDLVNISMSPDADIFSNMILDLSGTKLVNYMSYSMRKMPFKAPSTFRKLSYNGGNATQINDFSLVTQMDTISLYNAYGSSSQLVNVFSSFASLDSLNSLTVDRWYIDDLSIFAVLNDISLTSLTFSNAGNVAKCVRFSSISGLENLKELKSLSVSYNLELSDLSGFANLDSLESVKITRCSKLSNIAGIEFLSKLKALSLYGCNVSSLKGIENLISLESLNVENNCLTDLGAYYDSGTTISYNNLELIAGLNYRNGGSLKELYLTGNNGIIDFSPISNLSWTKKSGF